jgi:hypothetical protein
MNMQDDEMVELMADDIDERMAESFSAQADVFELLGVDAFDVVSALLNVAAARLSKEDRAAFMQAAEVIFDHHTSDRDTIPSGGN